MTRGDSRATAAAIERTHTAALQGLADLLREACLHYGKPWAGGSLAAAVASVPGVAV